MRVIEYKKVTKKITLSIATFTLFCSGYIPECNTYFEVVTTLPIKVPGTLMDYFHNVYGRNGFWASIVNNTENENTPSCEFVFLNGVKIVLDLNSRSIKYLFENEDISDRFTLCDQDFIRTIHNGIEYATKHLETRLNENSGSCKKVECQGFWYILYENGYSCLHPYFN